MTDARSSRKHACIRGGANTSKLSLLGLLWVAAACQGDSSTRPDRALPQPLPELAEPAAPDREKARLVRANVYGAGAEDAAGARVVLEVAGRQLLELIDHLAISQDGTIAIAELGDGTILRILLEYLPTIIELTTFVQLPPSIITKQILPCT